MRSCLHNEPAIINQPSEQKKVKFSNYKARRFALVVIYFDLESVMRQLAQCCQEKQKNSNCRKLHEPCGFCLVGVEHGKTEPPFVQLERSKDCMEMLVKALETIAREFHQWKQTHINFTGAAPIDP